MIRIFGEPNFKLRKWHSNMNELETTMEKMGSYTENHILELDKTKPKFWVCYGKKQQIKLQSLFVI